MNRFFVSPIDIDLENKDIKITGEDVKHISKVLRLTTEDLVEVCDGEKHEYIGKIKNISKEYILLDIVEKREIQREAPVEISLYQSIPKGAKMEFIIQKTIELGVNNIIPVSTERSIVQFKDNKDREKKVDRWQKIAEEAAKQSKRGVIPKIHMPISFKDALNHGKSNQLNIIAYEKEESNGIRDLINKEKNNNINKIGIWIGPEGGFSREEISLATTENLQSITLGPRILRTETAGLAVSTIIMYELGDLGGLCL